MSESAEVAMGVASAPTSSDQVRTSYSGPCPPLSQLLPFWSGNRRWVRSPQVYVQQLGGGIMSTMILWETPGC